MCKLLWCKLGHVEYQRGNHICPFDILCNWSQFVVVGRWHSVLLFVYQLRVDHGSTSLLVLSLFMWHLAQTQREYLMKRYVGMNILTAPNTGQRNTNTWRSCSHFCCFVLSGSVCVGLFVEQVLAPKDSELHVNRDLCKQHWESAPIHLKPLPVSGSIFFFFVFLLFVCN